MKQILKSNTVYIGVIPGLKNLAGVPFRTELSGSYHSELEDCKYMCLINGGRNRYFFIEERYFFFDKPPGDKLGNIKRIHRFNKHLQEGLPDIMRRTRIPFSYIKNRRR